MDMNTITLSRNAKVLGTLATSWLVLLERMAYYGVRTVMVVWMIRELGWSDQDAFTFYGTVTAIVYLAGVPGGLLSDLLLGSRWMIVLMCALSGIFLFIAGTSEALVFKISLALAFLTSGMAKPNYWNLISGLYKREDDDRDLSLLTLYAAINIGALLATTIIAYLAATYGYAYGFFISGVLMLAASVSALLFKDLLPNIHTDTGRLNSLTQLFRSPAEWIRLAQLFLIFIMLGTFWSTFELWGASRYEWLTEHGPLALFGGLTITVDTFSFLNPVFSFVFTGVLIMLYLVTRERQWTSMRSWAPISLFLGLCLLAAMSAWGVKGTVGLMIGLIALEAMAELWINALGFSMASRLAPQRFIATTIGGLTLVFWFTNMLSPYFQGDPTMMNEWGSILLWVMCACALLYAVLSHVYQRLGGNAG